MPLQMSRIVQCAQSIQFLANLPSSFQPLQRGREREGEEEREGEGEGKRDQTDCKDLAAALQEEFDTFA